MNGLLNSAEGLRDCLRDVKMVASTPLKITSVVSEAQKDGAETVAEDGVGKGAIKEEEKGLKEVTRSCAKCSKVGKTEGEGKLIRCSRCKVVYYCYKAVVVLMPIEIHDVYYRVMTFQPR